MYLLFEKKTLHYQLCSNRYSGTNQQLFKKKFCNQSSHYENYRWFLQQMEAITCLPQNQHFSWWTKMNGTQRRAVVSPWRMHCVYSGMAKGTSWADAMSNSEKIKPVALAIVELRESEGIRQAGRQGYRRLWGRTMKKIHLETSQNPLHNNVAVLVR